MNCDGWMRLVITTEFVLLRLTSAHGVGDKTVNTFGSLLQAAGDWRNKVDDGKRGDAGKFQLPIGDGEEQTEIGAGEEPFEIRVNFLRNEREELKAAPEKRFGGQDAGGPIKQEIAAGPEERWEYLLIPPKFDTRSEVYGTKMEAVQNRKKTEVAASSGKDAKTRGPGHELETSLPEHGKQYQSLKSGGLKQDNKHNVNPRKLTEKSASMTVMSGADSAKKNKPAGAMVTEEKAHGKTERGMAVSGVQLLAMGESLMIDDLSRELQHRSLMIVNLQQTVQRLRTKNAAARRLLMAQCKRIRNLERIVVMRLNHDLEVAKRKQHAKHVVIPMMEILIIILVTAFAAYALLISYETLCDYCCGRRNQRLQTEVGGDNDDEAAPLKDGMTGVVVAYEEKPNGDPASEPLLKNDNQPAVHVVHRV